MKKNLFKSFMLTVTLLLCVCLSAPLFTGATSSEQENLFPADLFKDKTTVSAYFNNAGDTYTQEDGDYVMTIPADKILNSVNPVAFEEYTICYDFQMIEGGASHLLFGIKQNGGTPWTQVSFEILEDTLTFSHFRHNGAGWDVFPDEVTAFPDITEKVGVWFHVRIEVTAESAKMYFEDTLVTTMANTAGLNGESGYLGMRGNYKIKNLAVYEGIVDDSTPASSDAVTPTPSATVSAQATPTVKPNPGTGDSNVGILLVLGFLAISVIGIMSYKKMQQTR